MARRALLLLLPLLVVGCRRVAPTVEVSVFFTRAEETAIVLAEVRRTVPRGNGEALLRAALAELLKGPTQEEAAQGLVSAIPAETRLRGARIAGGVAQVDLTREVESGGGSASMLGRFWQVVYTATQFPQAARAQILIDGERREAMGGEGVLIEEPVARPPTPPRF